MKYTEKDLYKGMKLRCIDDGLYDFWTEGAIYTVEENPYGGLIIKGEGDRSDRPTYDILNYLNGKTLVKMEIVEEEKEMPKYAKITKYAGFNEIDKRNGLEIGKTYKIVSYDNALTNDCRIYLNDKHPRYFISETQYELVEKEHPVADVKEAIQAKIDALTTEAERLFTKRDRLEEHAINLNAKAQKLKEVIETIKEFE